MWNPFRSSQSNSDSARDAVSVSGVALHELGFGDARCIVYSANEEGIKSIQYIGLQSGANSHRANDYEYIVRNIPDVHYAYGTLYTPIIDDSIVYEDMASKNYREHTLIRVAPIDGNYHSWVAVETDKVIDAQKTKSDQCMGSGSVGLSRLFGLNDDTFLHVSIERYHSIVSLLRGEHVLAHVMTPIGTSALVRTISDTLCCPTDMARRIIETHGVLDTHYDSRLKNRIIATFDPVLELVDSVVRLYGNSPYRPVFMHQPISSWILSGAGASIPGVASLLNTGIPCFPCTEIDKPYHNLIVEMPTGPTSSVLPKYYTALGLAIAGA